MPPETVPIHTSLLTRPFSSRLIVLNPDRAAVIRRKLVTYSAHAPGDPGIPSRSTYAAGKSLFEFDGVDYPFKALPRSISMDSHSTAETRIALSLAEQDAQSHRL